MKSWFYGGFFLGDYASRTSHPIGFHLAQFRGK